MSKYDELMKPLDPRVIIAKTEAPHDNARESFSLPSSMVRSHAEFQRDIIAYVAHDRKHTQGMAPPAEFCLDIAKKALDQTIGYENAVDLGMTGDQGGMVGVLNQINDVFKKESRQAYYRYILDSYVDPLCFEDVVALMRGLKARIQAYSPASFQYLSPEAMAGDYRNHLWTYITTLPRHKNLWVK